MRRQRNQQSEISAQNKLKKDCDDKNKKSERRAATALAAAAAGTASRNSLPTFNKMANKSKDRGHSFPNNNKLTQNWVAIT